MKCAPAALGVARKSSSSGNQADPASRSATRLARSVHRARAADYIDRIVARLERIALAPQGGSPRADLGPAFRSVPFERRITIVYRLSKDAVVISGIFYGGQDIARHYRKRDR